MSTKGIEVDLKEIGCPYTAHDARTPAWLNGYREGHRVGMDAARKIFGETLSEAREQ